MTVDGAGTLISGTTYRYSFSGNFGTGAVQVDFVSDRWRDNDANGNLAESESFTVINFDPAPPTADLADPPDGDSILLTTLNGRKYIDVTFEQSLRASENDCKVLPNKFLNLRFLKHGGVVALGHKLQNLIESHESVS